MHQILAGLNFISKYCYACSNIVNEYASFMKMKHVAATVEVLQKPLSVIDGIWKLVTITLFIKSTHHFEPPTAATIAFQASLIAKGRQLPR
ncbi:hypothetical protein C2S51_037029 [Perilla frutescens var. frutescens]|nr:hypothetical protein C2S51_037029 [Perilla frutescens var. frutescens]